jgi:hypothetical protein
MFLLFGFRSLVKAAAKTFLLRRDAAPTVWYLVTDVLAKDFSLKDTTFHSFIEQSFHFDVLFLQIFPSPLLLSFPSLFSSSLPPLLSFSFTSKT